MKCHNCDCEDKSHVIKVTRQKHWTDAVRHVCSAVAWIALFYVIARCSGVSIP